MPAARLPRPGQDTGTWGDLLNGYLRSFALNVQDYGADPDGSSDSAQAIIDTINAASTNGGGIVFIPEGTYIIEKNIEMKSNVVLSGAGYNSLLRKKNNSGNFNIIGQGSVSNVIIENFRIDGNRANSTEPVNGGQTAHGGIAFWGGSDNTIRNMWVEKTCTTAIYLYGPRNRVLNTIVSDISSKSTTWANTIGKSGIVIDGESPNGPAYSQVIGNRVIGTGEHGVKIYVGGNYSVVSNNVIENVQQYGIYLMGQSFTTISSNTVNNCYQSGIIAGDGSNAAYDCSIIGNTSSGSRNEMGITGVGGRNAIVGNICRGNTGGAISVANMPNSQQAGNIT